jgi:hypothetical protein
MSPPPPEATAVLTSYESRWFFSGSPPAGLVETFRSPGHWETDPGISATDWSAPRTDRYLVFVGDMGIKTRRDPGAAPRLEFKGRLTDRGLEELAPDVVGRAEEWVKWSYTTGDVPEELLQAVVQGAASVPVTKERLLRVVRLDPGHRYREVAPGSAIPRGVQLELARLRTEDGQPVTAWTVALEAFPVHPDLARDVYRAAGPFLALLARAGGVDLGPEATCSYPAWLSGGSRSHGFRNR